MISQQLNDIAKALEQVSTSLQALDKAGKGIPSVEKNVVRMRGSLRALEAQFADLAELSSGT